MAKLSVFVAFWSLLNVCQAVDLCPSQEVFEENNLTFMGLDYLNTKEKYLYNFINYIILFSYRLSNGANGVIYELRYNKDIVYKELDYTYNNKKDDYHREVRTVRYLCGVKEEKYNTITDCRLLAVVNFMGCIFDNNKIYLFLEKMHSDFSKKEAKDDFHALSAFEKLRIFLDIIDLFIELHAKGIVHSDVKPANIMMKYMGFKGIRIVDFGSADKIGEEYHSGTPGYLPPEMYLSHNEEYKLHPRVDIYGLAVTFAQMAGEFNPGITYISREIQEANKNWKTSYEVLIDKYLGRIFNSEENLSAILPYIKKALSFDKYARFQSMKKIADIFISILKDIYDSKTLLTEYFQKLQNENSKNELFGYSKVKLVLEFGTPEQKEKFKEKNKLSLTQKKFMDNLQQSKQSNVIIRSQPIRSQRSQRSHQSQQLLQQSQLEQQQEQQQKQQKQQQSQPQKLKNYSTIRQKTEENQLNPSIKRLQSPNLNHRIVAPKDRLQQLPKIDNFLLPKINKNMIKQKLIV